MSLTSRTAPGGPRAGRETRSKAPRLKLSMSGRPKGLGDHTELLVARLIGRSLTPIQGCVVQIAVIAVFCYLAWAFIASGLMMRIVEPVSRWYAEQAMPHLVPPSTLP